MPFGVLDVLLDELIASTPKDSAIDVIVKLPLSGPLTVILSTARTLVFAVSVIAPVSMVSLGTYAPPVPDPQPVAARRAQ